MILQSLGPQTEDDLSFLSSKHAINYVMDLGPKKKENNTFVDDSAEPALITQAKIF